MPKKSATVDQTDESSNLLNEFAAETASATSSKKAAKEKAPKSEKQPREKAPKPEKPAKTLTDVVVEQEHTPSPWIIMRVLEIAQKRMRAAQPGEITVEQALGDVASLYAQLAADAVALSNEAGVDESSAASVGRLMSERFEHMLPRLGQVFGQPKRPVPYTRDEEGNVVKTGLDDSDAQVATDSDDESFASDGESAERSAADDFFGR